MKMLSSSLVVDLPVSLPSHHHLSLQAVVATKIIISMGWQGSALSYHEDPVEVVHFLCRLRVNIKMTLKDIMLFIHLINIKNI